MKKYLQVVCAIIVTPIAITTLLVSGISLYMLITEIIASL